MRSKTEERAPRKPWTRRKKWLVGGVLPALLLAGGAGAAWIALATGTSNVQTVAVGNAGTQPVTIVIGSMSGEAPLTPGNNGTVLDTDEIPYTVTNPSTTTPVQVDSVHFTITGVSNAGCSASDFTVSDPTTIDFGNELDLTLPIVLGTSSNTNVQPPSNYDQITNDGVGGQATIGLNDSNPACENASVSIQATAS